MNKKRSTLLALLITLVFISNGFSEHPWVLVKDNKGQKVYRQAVDGSPYHKLQAVGYADVPFEVAVEVAKDEARYYEWYGMCRKLDLITKRTPYDCDMYFILDVPVVKDRDLVVNVKKEWDYAKGVCTVHIDRIESSLKSDSGLIRMTRMNGVITITREGPQRIKCTYSLYAELGGTLPSWIINLLAWKHPYDTGLGALNQVYKPVYWESAKIALNRDFGTPPPKPDYD